MKQIGTFSKLAALGLALTAAFFITSAQAVTNAGTQQGKAKVVKITGNATYNAANGEKGNLKVGQILEAGATISTGVAATVELNLGVNGNLLVIKPDTTVAIDQLDFTGTGADTVANTRLNLTKGGLNGNVKKLARNSNYEIKTANGVAGVRGTAYTIDSNGVVHVWDGAVNITYTVRGVSKTVTVLQGQTMYPPDATHTEPYLGEIPTDWNRSNPTRVEDTTIRRPFGDSGTVFVSPTTGVRGSTPVVHPPIEY